MSSKIIKVQIVLWMFAIACNPTAKPDSDSVINDSSAYKKIPVEEPNKIDTSKIENDALLKADSLNH